MSEGYRDFLFIRKPLIKVQVEPVEGTEDLLLNPPLEDLRRLLHSILQKMLLVNEKVPRIENFLFPGMLTAFFICSIS